MSTVHGEKGVPITTDGQEIIKKQRKEILQLEIECNRLRNELETAIANYDMEMEFQKLYKSALEDIKRIAYLARVSDYSKRKTEALQFIFKKCREALNSK